MRQPRTDDRNSQIFLAISGLFLISLFYSKFALSLCIILFALFAIYNIYSDSNVKSFSAQKKGTLALSLVFFLVALSGIFSNNFVYLSHHLQLKLPFLVFPFCFISYTWIDEKLVWKILDLLIIICILSSIGVFYQYFSNFEEVNTAISQGRGMPTPVPNICYSLVTVFAALCSLLKFEQSENTRKWVYVACFAYLFVFVHVIASRSGIVCIYISLITHAILRAINVKRYGLLRVVVSLLFIMPITGFYIFPSLYNKVGYMIWDFTMMQKGYMTNYSDGGRILSYMMAKEFFLEYPIFGVGIGDVLDHSKNWYEQHITDFGGKINFPHNQFLFVTMWGGLFSLIIYCFSLLYGFVSSKSWKHPYTLSIFIILFTSFLVENTLERAVPIAFFLYFICLFFNEKSSTKTQESTI